MESMSKKFIGKWRIIEMDQWDQDFIDAEVQGHITFSNKGIGEFQFGYVHGYIDYRSSKSIKGDSIEFSWEGNDEMDPALGRGTATIQNGELEGYIYFHQGDESGFKAVRT